MSTSTMVQAQRQHHEKRVLNALRASGPLTRAELSKRVGLSRTTLSEITATLLERGAIIVADTDATARTGSGRPAEVLALDPASGQYLGVDFGHRRVQMAVADASHEIIASGVERYADDTPWDERLRLAFALIERVGADTGIHFGAVQAVGIGVPGPYTGRAGGASVRWAAKLAPADVERRFAERFGAPIVIDNNTRLAALAEAISSKRDAVGDLLFARLSDGIGGGIVVGGRLVPGAQGLAGEVGHVTADPQGRECRCGKRGCLETIASVPAILRTLRERGVPTETLDDLAAHVEREDPVVDSVLREAGTAVGRVLGAAAMTLNPAEVVIGGEIVSIAPVVVSQAAATLRYELYSMPSDQPIIVRSGMLTDTAGALGAIAAIFHQSPLLAGYPETAEETPFTRERSAR